MLRSVIQRTLKRRGTVALTLSSRLAVMKFDAIPGNSCIMGEHFLLAVRCLYAHACPAAVRYPGRVRITRHPPIALAVLLEPRRSIVAAGNRAQL